MMEKLLTKLNFSEGRKACLLNWQNIEALRNLSDAMAESGHVTRDLPDEIKDGFILLFAMDEATLASQAPLLQGRLTGDCVLWVIYPKKSAPDYTTYIHRDAEAWACIGQLGYEAVRMISLDTNFSALRFRNLRYIKKMTRSPKRSMTQEGKLKTTHTPSSDIGEFENTDKS